MTMAARKASTIGSNPLDQVVPMRRAEPPPEPDEPKARERVTIALSSELMERARNAVYWTPGATLAGLVEDAVADAMDRLEKEHGGPFKARSANLKPGRRVKV